jgi:hypothetical protein
MFIEAIGISGYKSFGAEFQGIGPFAKINLFIGQNNSGKSNILTFLTQQYNQVLKGILRREAFAFRALDRHLGDSGNLRFALGLKIGGPHYHSLLSKYADAMPGPIRHKDPIRRILQSKTLTSGKNVAWFYYHSESPNGPLVLDGRMVADLTAESVLTNGEWSQTWTAMTRRSGGSLRDWIPETLGSLSPTQFGVAKVELIPAIRRIGEKGSTTSDHSGIDLIDRLAQLQNPNHSEQHLKQQFEDINEFLRRVAGNASARLEIPYQRDAILVHMDQKTLPLSSLGRDS